jgi:hypothetical protein
MEDYRDIHEKVSDGYYWVLSHLQLEKPEPIQIAKKRVREEVEANFVGTLSEIQAEIVRREKQVERKAKAYNKKVTDAYVELEREFMRDLFEHYGVTDNPKAEMLYYLLDRTIDSKSDLLEKYGDYVCLIE